ncbi:MAG: hypothetical protein NUW02_00975 [Candidatus Campbellbacteria bacterium]|nr:hypothetical protein [Candidatus Campbellbacteria bacterium]
MCEFVSWIQPMVGDPVFLVDRDLKDKVIRKRVEGSQGKDFIGHGAIRAAFPELRGGNREEQRIWESWRFPEKIQPYLKNPATVLATWGKMLILGLDASGLEFIVENAPPAWWKPIVDFFVAKKAKDSKWAYSLLDTVHNLTRRQRQILVESVAKNPQLADSALFNFSGLTKKQIQILVEGAAKNPEWAYSALRDTPDLSRKQKQVLIEGVVKDPRFADDTLALPGFTKKQRQILESAIRTK